MKIGHVVAHPHHTAAVLAFEPDSAPLGRPVVRVPDLVACSHDAGHTPDIEIATDREWQAQPSRKSSPGLVDVQAPADLGEAIRAIVFGGVDSDLMTLAYELAGQCHTLPFAPTLTDQLVDKDRNVHP